MIEIRGTLRAVLAVGVLLAAGNSAPAGGLERGGYNIDLLFDPAAFTFEATGSHVMPRRRLDNVVDTDQSDSKDTSGTGGGATSGIRETARYFVPRIGFKVGLTRNIDCMADYSQPWGAHSNPGADWMGAKSNIETRIESDNYAATCSYRMDAGKGQFRLIGGAFHQQVEGFKERLVAPVGSGSGSGIGRLELEGSGWGWRIGAAYEIPEIAFRASLVYNSRVGLDNLAGTVDLTQIPSIIDPRNPFLGVVTPVYGAASMPESLEFKIRSGIAPGWIAFGSVKWVNWSILQTVPFCADATRGSPCTAANALTSFNLLYRDGWTVSAGLGHKLSEHWSAAGSVTWDRGTSHGYGHQTDSWTFGGGVSYRPNGKVEIRLAGALGILTSGSSAPIATDGLSYTFGNDLVSAVSARMKLQW